MPAAPSSRADDLLLTGRQIDDAVDASRVLNRSIVLLDQTVKQLAKEIVKLREVIANDQSGVSNASNGNGGSNGSAPKLIPTRRKTPR